MRAAIVYLATMLAILAATFIEPRVLREPSSAVPHASWSRAVTASATSTRPSYVGVILAEHAIDLSSPRGGLVVDVAATVGMHVAEGDALLRLDARALRHELDAARVEEERSRDRLARDRRLHGAGIVADEEILQAKLASRAKVAHMRRIGADLADAELHAPFAGVIVLVHAERGLVLEPGTPAMRIVGDGDRRLRFGVSALDARGLHPGAQVWFRDADDPDADEHKAIVRAVAAEVDRSSELVVVDATVGDATQLPSGRRVRVFLSAASTPLVRAASGSRQLAVSQ